MPELPEVETTCSGIRPHLVGNSILSVDVHQQQLRWEVAEEIFEIQNAPVLSVERRAKYIFIQLTSGSIISHLGMSGSFRICEPEEELKKHDHLVFHLSSGKQLRYHDPRRFGCALFATDPHQHPLIVSQGPEPLSEDFALDSFIAKAKQSKSSIKQYIMNNKTVVGVGNIYANESLFLSGIHPKRVASKVSKLKLTNLHANIQSVLQAAIKQGGTTLKDFSNAEGKPGYFQQQLYVYDQADQPCQACNSPIKRIMLGQRATYFCPKCQK